jgi:hypothetical protein
VFHLGFEDLPKSREHSAPISTHKLSGTCYKLEIGRLAIYGCRFQEAAACNNKHKLAEPTSISCPKMAIFKELLPRSRGLSKDKLAVSSSFQS